MQLMWASSPLGKMHSISVRTRWVACALATLAAVLVVAGVAGSVVAFKFAFELAPQFVTRLGGVMTASDLQKRDAEYRKKLADLYGELASATQQIEQLRALKEEFARLATPRGPGRAPAAKGAKGPMVQGKGGPELVLGRGEPQLLPNKDEGELVSVDMIVARERLQQLNVSLNAAQADWQKELLRIEHLPTAQPLTQARSVSSHYGVRLDPFTHRPSRHDGVDFSAEPGTPILAAASGIVARVVTDPQYGKMVEIDHRNGYLTRYAHARAIHVKTGAPVKRGDAIGEVGSTGRSTAPHLHYEIRFLHKTQNPRHYQIVANDR
jgi:murein DD-endopeptidase MepM/ murein hydrolase activator NlpD